MQRFQRCPGLLSAELSASSARHHSSPTEAAVTTMACLEAQVGLCMPELRAGLWHGRVGLQPEVNSNTWCTLVIPLKPEPEFPQVSPSCPGTGRGGSCSLGQRERRTVVDFSPLTHSLSSTCPQCNKISVGSLFWFMHHWLRSTTLNSGYRA